MRYPRPLPLVGRWVNAMDPAGDCVHSHHCVPRRFIGYIRGVGPHNALKYTHQTSRPSTVHLTNTFNNAIMVLVNSYVQPCGEDFPLVSQFDLAHYDVIDH